MRDCVAIRRRAEHAEIPFREKLPALACQFALMSWPSGRLAHDRAIAVRDVVLADSTAASQAEIAKITALVQRCRCRGRCIGSDFCRPRRCWPA